MPYSSSTFEWAETRRGCPVPPPSIISFQSLNLHVYRILWRVTSWVITVLVSALIDGVFLEAIAFYSSAIHRTRYMDITRKALMHLAVPLTAIILSELGLSWAVGQQAPSSGPQDQPSGAYDALQTCLHILITLARRILPLITISHEFF